MSDDENAAAHFDAERQRALELLKEDSITGFYLGVIHEGETADSTFAQLADDPQQEGLQALSLLATHVRIVANESGADPEMVAGDAATLAARLEELSPGELSDVRDGDGT